MHQLLQELRLRANLKSSRFSAANFLLLNEYHNFVDMNGVDVNTIVKLVFDFCKAKPNDKPVSAIDKFIRNAKKVDVKEKDVFNPWEQ
jgi:hypothetical protein